MKYYDRLVDVKIIAHNNKKRFVSTWELLFESSHDDEQSNDSQWVAVYHTIKDKYIVTNSIIDNGLNANAKDVVIIGYADTIDSIMFVVYEHQISQGKKFTILDEIKQMKNDEIIKVNDKEWEWNKNKDNRKKTMTGLFSTLEVDI